MSMTNRDLARKAAVMCRDVISGTVTIEQDKRVLNMFFGAEMVNTSHGKLEVTAYSYGCPMYQLYYRPDIEKYEFLVNATIYSPTTAKHMGLYMQELRNHVDLHSVGMYRVDLGETLSNGVRSRLDNDVIFGASRSLDEAIEKVYKAARKGTRIITVERTVIEALDETVRLQDLVAKDIPEADICSERAFVISRANTQQRVLSNIAFKTAPENMKTAINGLKALAGRPEESLSSASWASFDLQPCD